ncbi:hypothetical protein ACGFSB_36130 [Streptomyces sp. NPDC048441]|uniref:hypothetical protein n=1 Tax=Streptomyces sp. NPDC048441 TaxID=3365552 RepID=UPI00371F61E2
MTGEHTPTPGVTWDTELVHLGEVVVDIDRCENPFGWSEPDTTGPDMNQPLPPRPNRETRRALARAARRNTK